MFSEMLEKINEQVVELIFKAQLQPEPMMPRRSIPQQMTTIHDAATGMGFSGPPARESGRDDGSARGKKQPVVVGEKVGRNEPCPCGSGKKYKKCHGAI